MKLTRITSFLKRWNWQAISRSFWIMVFAFLFVITMPGVRPEYDDDFQTLGIARNHLFNFTTWWTETVLDKAANATLSPHIYMDANARVAYVRGYLQLVYNIAQLEIEVQNIYIDPRVDDPETASADLRTERDRLRAEQQSQQALAEAIIQSQISEMLVEYGFGLGGQILPPSAIRFTQLPTLLVVSPRDHIERTGSYPLEHGLTVDQMEVIERGVAEELDVSSLIVPLGGLAVYPAMLIETGYTPHVYDIGAHEWVHHHLAFFPLGFNYGQTPTLYTINETVAGMVGTEIGWAVMDRYYPDLAPPPPDYTPLPPPEPAPPGEPPEFDFRAEMRETRIRVDELLVAGQIEEAEQYMEERRVMFVEEGYRIRKINQAYFAFYGAYADEPGATGADPIGPALRELRYYSPSLYDFIATVRGMTTFEEVLIALEEARRAAQIRE